MYYMLKIDYKRKTAYVVGNNAPHSDEFRKVAKTFTSESDIFEFENNFYSQSKEALKLKEFELKKQWRRNYLLSILDHYCQQHKYRHRVDISPSGSIYYIYYIYDKTLIKIRIADHPQKENCAHIYLRIDEELNKPNKTIRANLLGLLNAIEKKVKKRTRDYLLLKLGGTK